MPTTPLIVETEFTRNKRQYYWTLGFYGCLIIVVACLSVYYNREVSNFFRKIKKIEIFISAFTSLALERVGRFAMRSRNEKWILDSTGIIHINHSQKKTALRWAHVEKIIIDANHLIVHGKEEKVKLEYPTVRKAQIDLAGKWVKRYLKDQFDFSPPIKTWFDKANTILINLSIFLMVGFWILGELWRESYFKYGWYFLLIVILLAIMAYIKGRKNNFGKRIAPSLNPEIENP